jgi:hypothetical protein
MVRRVSKEKGAGDETGIFSRHTTFLYVVIEVFEKKKEEDMRYISTKS